MLMRRASKTEGRKGSQRRLDEGGRYLGIPQNGGLVAPRTGSDDADAHNSGLLSVQETGCGTDGVSRGFVRNFRTGLIIRVRNSKFESQLREG